MEETQAPAMMVFLEAFASGKKKFKYKEGSASIKAARGEMQESGFDVSDL